MRPAYRLVPDTISDDTIEALRQLLKDAESGQIIGIAFVAMHRKRIYIANSAGEAKRNPTFTRGMLAALDDQLAEGVMG